MKNVLMKRPNKTWESDQPKKDNLQFAVFLIIIIIKKILASVPNRNKEVK